MTTTIEWASARERLVLIQGNEEAADGNTPNDGNDSAGRVALAVGGCAIYGTPADLLELFADGITQVSAHLAGQQ